MNTRDEILKRIEKKQEEIRGLENNVREAMAYIQALQDTLKLLPKDKDSQLSACRSLRKGSEMEKVRLFLLKAGKPLYIEDILKGIGKEKESRNAIAGSLSAYTRRNEIFTRPEPGTFGLIELETKEPPPDFGEQPETLGSGGEK